MSWVSIIDDFYKDFEKSLTIAEAEMKEIEIKDEPAGEDCEKCGNPMVFKMGRFGKFMACSNFPDCRNTKAIVKLIGVKCPSVRKVMSLKEKPRNGAFSSAVINIQNVILYHGISQLKGHALNVKAPLLRKSIKKAYKFSALTVIIKKSHSNKSVTHE